MVKLSAGSKPPRRARGGDWGVGAAAAESACANRGLFLSPAGPGCTEGFERFKVWFSGVVFGEKGAAVVSGMSRPDRVARSLRTGVKALEYSSVWVHKMPDLRRSKKGLKETVLC